MIVCAHTGGCLFYCHSPLHFKLSLWDETAADMHSCLCPLYCLSASVFSPFPYVFNLYWDGPLEYLRTLIYTHIHAHTPTLTHWVISSDSFPSSDTAASLASCPCLLLFPITNNSGEFPSFFSWGIFITAQSPCPEGLSALNCSTAVVWTLSSKTDSLFTNTRWT